ncbi:MAG TPA: type II secretion system F family protein [Blastocatellia bacterium]|nr:type II secretion system F family protein [Blastocatellia bacterium]
MLLIFYIATMMSFLGIGMAVYFWLARPVSPFDERLREINPRVDRGTPTPPVTKKVNTVIVERVAKPVYKITRPSNRNLRRLRRRLVKAGFSSENAVSVYVVVRLVVAFIVPIAVLLVLLALDFPRSPQFVALVMLGAIFGLFMPSFNLSRMISKRQQKIARALPDAIDLMVVCVEAGLGLNAALQRVGRELELVEPVLAGEMAITNREIRAGKPRDEALRNLGDRTGVDDIKSLVAMLIQSDRFGTSIASSLRVFADSMRTKRRQRAEEMVSKASIKLLFPLLLFIFPALLIVLLGPALITLYRALDQLAK